MANFGRGKDKQKRKARNVLGSALKVGAGLATVGTIYNQRKNLSKLGNRVVKKIKDIFNKNKNKPNTTTPATSNPTQQADEWREQFVQKEMKRVNDLKEKTRLAKEAEKAAKRKTNIKRQRSNVNTTNRNLVKEANNQKQIKTLDSLFDDVDSSKFDDFDILPSKSKGGKGFGKSQTKSNKKKNTNKSYKQLQLI